MYLLLEERYRDDSAHCGNVIVMKVDFYITKGFLLEPDISRFQSASWFRGRLSSRKCQDLSQ